MASEPKVKKVIDIDFPIGEPMVIVKRGGDAVSFFDRFYPVNAFAFLIVSFSNTHYDGPHCFVNDPILEANFLKAAIIVKDKGRCYRGKNYKAFRKALLPELRKLGVSC